MRVLSVYDDRTGSGSSFVIPDGDPDYHELLEEVKKLRLELAEARQQAQDNWDTIEDVSCGAGLECTSCGKKRPCLCQDT